jgi:hypothetical protein
MDISPRAVLGWDRGHNREVWFPVGSKWLVLWQGRYSLSDQSAFPPHFLVFFPDKEPSQ